MNKLPTLILTALLLAPLAALHVNGAPSPEFNRKAATLFATNYFYHAWDETDHAVDGEDWSLPLWVKPARYSAGRRPPARPRFGSGTTASR